MVKIQDCVVLGPEPDGSLREALITHHHQFLPVVARSEHRFPSRNRDRVPRVGLEWIDLRHAQVPALSADQIVEYELVRPAAHTHEITVLALRVHLKKE